MQPVLLPANTPATFYRGAGRISRFRGLPAPHGTRPEDWIGSTTSRYGAGSDEPGASSGLTVLPDGRLLVDAIAQEPARWLGEEHVARHGADPTILVKLLDAGQRLPLHVHPDRRFARSHLASPYGKTEAWAILDASPDAVVYLGFRRAVEADELADWVAGQRVDAMLAAANVVPVRPGDTVLVPAGLPHAIGPGIFLLEAQEPTDFSLLLEWQGFELDADAAFLGLPREQALSLVDSSQWTDTRLERLRGSVGPATEPLRPGVYRLFPPAAEEFFAGEWLDPDPVSELDASFSILVVATGRGVLTTETGQGLDGGASLAVAAGDTLLIPYGSGRSSLEGKLTAIRCKPAPVRG
jgi:mannose-6-phosphate isomerase